MTINAGIWIDHHKAVLVILNDGAETVETIHSDLAISSEQGLHKTEPNTYTRNDFVPEDRLERKAMSHFKKHYDDVISHLHDAEAIFIMGPGEAKGEFGKRLEVAHLKAKVTHIETADKMTDRQVAAHVRDVFEKPSNRKK
jgi:stalled ribosome rescue protein Dom34